MNWSLLFPTTVNPWQAITGMFSGGAHALSDGIIWLTILIAVVTLLYALWRLYSSWHLVGRYLRVLPTSPDPHTFGEIVENDWPKAANVPLLTEFRRLLVTIPSPSAKQDWDIEVFFKQVKQTLKLGTFLGHSANAVRWQVFSALLVYVLLRFEAHLSNRGHSFTRLFAVVRAALWERLDLRALLSGYGQAGGSFKVLGALQQAWLPGFARGAP